jgi:hypothetical protein
MPMEVTLGNMFKDDRGQRYPFLSIKTKLVRDVDHPLFLRRLFPSPNIPPDLSLLPLGTGLSTAAGGYAEPLVWGT